LAEYMHSGESATRLGSVTDRKVIGVKSKGMDMLGFLEKDFKASLALQFRASSLAGSPAPGLHAQRGILS
jgi:hypothetical protein